MKKIEVIHELLKDKELTKKIRIYFSVQSVGDDFDPEEGNYTKTALNPITINGIVRSVSPEALVWKQYGLSETGSVEILTDKKYKTWFENCHKIEIDNDIFTVFKDTTGSRAVMQERPNDILRVVLQKRSGVI